MSTQSLKLKWVWHFTPMKVLLQAQSERVSLLLESVHSAPAALALPLTAHLHLSRPCTAALERQLLKTFQRGVFWNSLAFIRVENAGISRYFILFHVNIAAESGKKSLSFEDFHPQVEVNSRLSLLLKGSGLCPPRPHHEYFSTRWWFVAFGRHCDFALENMENAVMCWNFRYDYYLFRHVSMFLMPCFYRTLTDPFRCGLHDALLGFVNQLHFFV